MTEDREALKTALLHALGERIAACGALIVGVAAELYPDEIRKALDKVLYDYSSVEEGIRRMTLILTEAQEKAHDTAREVRELVDQVHGDLDGVDQRIDGLSHRVEKGHRAVSYLAKVFNKLQQQEKAGK